MEGGAAVVDAGIDEWGYFDGVVCVAGILRERMLFNMTEEEWDDVLRVHLKGTFTVYRAAAAVLPQGRAPRLARRVHLGRVGAGRGRPAQLRRGQGRHRVVLVLRRPRRWRATTCAPT